jgi:hypothetical protein
VQDLTTSLWLGWTQIYFGSSSFGSVNLSFLWCLPQMDDSNHFGSLGFGSFNLSTLAFSRSAYTQSRRSVDACLPQIDDCKSLRLFGLREFQPLHTRFLLECLHLKSMISTCVLSLRSTTQKDSVTPRISKGTHDYPPSNFSRSDGHDPANTDLFIDRRFTVIVGPQRAHSLSESSTSAI